MAADNKCSDCGKDRELPQYANDSCCRACRSERNRLVRAGKMQAKGKRPQGSGRNPNCSKCGALKDPSFITSGYCRACKAESNQLKRLIARLDRGQLPLGEGRKIYCCECGKVKENLQSGYCHACASSREREARMHLKQIAGFLEAERAKVNKRSKDDPIFKLKKDIHLLTNAATRLGILSKQPCEVCGEIKVDAHHDDYNKPMDVRWLCRKHHNQHHRKYGEATLPTELLKFRN